MLDATILIIMTSNQKYLKQKNIGVFAWLIF